MMRPLRLGQCSTTTRCLPSFMVPQTPTVHQYKMSILNKDIVSAPPVETAFSDFVQEVKQHKVMYVDVSQDRRLGLHARTYDGEDQTVLLPPDFKIIDFLLSYNVGIDVHPLEKSQDVYSMLLIALQLSIAASIMVAVFGGAARGGMPNFMKKQPNVILESKTGKTFDDVAGADNAKHDLQEVVDFLKNPEKYVAVGAKIPKGVMLYGSPGCGKTLLAKAVAGEAGVPFISCSGSEFIEMFVGVGASRIRDIFKKAAEHAPCIIFIDEIESIARKRGVGINNDERDQTVNQLLTLMDGFEERKGVIVIAATNRLDMLDEAVLRPGRFDRKILVELPDFKGRHSILKVHTKDKPLDSSVDIEMIAKNTAGFSGADLENLSNEAAIYAARNKNTKITAHDFDLAFEKVVLGEERKTVVITAQKKRILSYHESGHALMGLLLNDYDKVRKVSIIPRGKTGGATYFEPTEERIDGSLVTREYLEHRIMVALGGRIAEELVFGFDQVTTGASGDIQEVYNIAHQMVARFGLSVNLGPIYWEESDNGTDVNNDIYMLVMQLYDRARDLMEKNIENLHRISEELMEKEVLSHEEIARLVRSIP